MRRPSTATIIVIAAVLAAVIVVASGTGRETTRPAAADGTTPLPAGHRVAQGTPLIGIVDTAAAGRSIPALERARRANPENVRIILNLGDAYLAALRYDDAAGAYRDALAASPGHPNAAVGLAMVWHGRGDDERAARLLERVLAAFPDHQQAHYALGLVLFTRQEVAAAREAWVRAAEIDPTSDLGRASQDFVELLSDGGRGETAL